MLTERAGGNLALFVLYMLVGFFENNPMQATGKR